MNNTNNYEFNNDLELIKPLNNPVDTLYVTGRFPPIIDTSGIVLAKKIIKSNKKVDVLCADMDLPEDELFNKIVNNYINEKYTVPDVSDRIEGILKFINDGIDIIKKNNNEYENIYSRSWTINSHFFALMYKLENPNVKWTAEFSDPLYLDINNKKRLDNKVVFDDDTFLNKINNGIKQLNDEGHDFNYITKNDGRYYLAEYLTYLFADNICFTNYHQRDIMLNEFSDEIKNIVMDKSYVQNHPIFEKTFYQIIKSNYPIDNNYINFAYFGTFYGTRHLEHLLYAFESLNENVAKKINFHIFSNEYDFIKEIISGYELNVNISINKTLNFLEFLNLTTKMDILIVNDTITKNKYSVNPYLPSKYADYKGSESKIWSICEHGSSLDKKNTSYKSYVDDYISTINTLNTILNDFGMNNKSKINQVQLNEFYQKRLTDLNDLLFTFYKQKDYWYNNNNSLNQEIKKLKNDLKTYEKINEDNLIFKNRIDQFKKDSLELENSNINFETDVNIKENELNELISEYNQLHAISEKTFNQIDEYKDNIQVYEDEINVYKNNKSLFNKYISIPLSKLYISIKIPKNDRKITKNLYEKILTNPWFNRNNYIENNNDLSDIFWFKILNPELHFVCYGINENRIINNKQGINLSKKELLKYFEYKY